MIRRKTSAIVESGILAAIAVIFTLIGNYIPVLDVIVSVWWPLPIILCGRRNGLMWSVLCLLVTGAVVAVLISPLQAVTQVLILGILGLVMGEGMRRQKSPASVLLWGSLGALLSVVLSGLAAYFLMGINVVESFTHAIAESVQMTKDIYDTLGVSGIMTTESLERMQHMLSLVLPAGLLLSCPISAFVNYWAARKVLSRLGDPYPWFPPLPRGPCRVGSWEGTDWVWQRCFIFAEMRPAMASWEATPFLPWQACCSCCRDSVWFFGTYRFGENRVFGFPWQSLPVS